MDSFTAALSRLDPASRALLDLSLRRGMQPDEISDLLGTEPESVVVAREGALEQLAGELGMDDVSELDDVRARLAELPAEAWTGEAAEPAQRPNLAVVRDEEKPQRAAPAEPPARERKSRLPWLLALLALAAVVLVVVLASSGSDNGKPSASSTPSQSKPKPSKPAPQPHPAKPGPRVALTPMGAVGGASGSAALTNGGKRLRIEATGLPDPHGGAYQVWLYDSVVDAVSLTKVGGTSLQLDLKLPRNASHYRYVDISLEPPDGNPNHSGESVLRVPLSSLSR